MSNLEFRIFYERNLPHIQPPGAVLFVTYRLAGSLPSEAVAELVLLSKKYEQALALLSDPDERAKERYRAQRRLFGILDARLDHASSGPRWLADPRVAGLVAESLHYLDGRQIDLDSYAILFNHVHALFQPLYDEQSGAFHSISSIMHSHKRFTARKANDLLGRQGQFWQHESYDHFVRDAAELGRIRRYILLNPVTAGLFDEWDKWPWTFSKELVGEGEPYLPTEMSSGA